MATGTEFKSIFKILSVVVVGFVIFKMFGKMEAENSTAATTREIQISKMTSLSAFGGFLSSVMAIGAGMIYVPAMKFFGNLETRKSIGSSLNIMMVVVPFAMVAHFMLLNKYQINQLIDESLLLIILVTANFSGSKMGAILGFKLFNENILMKVFIAVLSITWINYIFDLII
jgi:uncharacterized membrane protein YfcA